MKIDCNLVEILNREIIHSSHISIWISINNANLLNHLSKIMIGINYSRINIQFRNSVEFQSYFS